MVAPATTIPLGTLNRLRVAMQVPNFPFLNVTASFVGRRSIRIARAGNTVENLDVMTGIVPSGEPYVKMDVYVNLIKSQGLANAYEQQLQAQATIGNVIIRPDTSTLQQYTVYQSSIITVEELSFAGDSPDYSVHIAGYYPVNAQLYAS